MRNLLFVIMGAALATVLGMGYELANGYMTEGYGLHPVIVFWVGLLIVGAVIMSALTWES